MIYKNNFEHLFEELHRITLIVRLSLEKWGERHRGAKDDFMGLYISEDEVDSILQNLSSEPKTHNGSYLELESITEEIDKKKNDSIKHGKKLRLPLLGELFRLCPFELDVLLICLAAELDLRYEKLYAYLQDDVTKKRPTVDLVINLLCPSQEDRFRAREYFSPTAPLIKNRLIYLVGDEQGEHHPLLSKFIKVDERVIGFLLGSNEVDHKIRGFSSLVKPEKPLNCLAVAEETKSALTNLIRLCSTVNSPMILHFHGPYGTGKKAAAEAVSRKLGKPLLIVGSGGIVGEKTREILNLVLREGLLQDSSIYFERFNAVLKEGNAVTKASLIQKLDSFPNWIFLSGEDPWHPGTLNNHGFIDIAFPRPSYAIRRRLWESFFNGDVAEDVDFGALASKFNFSGGQIQDAVFTARNIAKVKGSGNSKITMEDLYHGCRAQSNKKLNALAKKIEPHYTWDDIVLPKDIKEQLKEVCGHIKYKGLVYADWGFDKKFSLGKGLNILFSGSSGTGKTMAAEIIAGEVELDLYKIDLSYIVSKYIGETEKNLRKIFREAETSNAILFFDEADALFGKRSEVRDSHDRYANIEINYLLQKMEEHEGIVILASNFRKNIDEAFLRRMHFTIEFPFPDENSREKIWTSIFPQETPLSDDVDFNFLAKFKITGGNIKNIALCAAFLAANDKSIVQMEHVIRAVKREFQKIGKFCTPSDFKEYYEFLK